MCQPYIESAALFDKMRSFAGSIPEGVSFKFLPAHHYKGGKGSSIN